MTTSTTEIARLSTITAAAFAAERNAETRAWLAANPGAWATTLVEDQSYWSNQGVETGLDLAHTLAVATLSDLYKEVHGIRPRWMDMGSMSLAELESRIDSLCEESRAQAEAEAEWEAQEEARRMSEELAAAENAAWASSEAGWAVQDALMGR